MTTACPACVFCVTSVFCKIFVDAVMYHVCKETNLFMDLTAQPLPPLMPAPTPAAAPSPGN